MIKPITFNVALKKTVRKYHVERKQEISVGDSATLEFKIIDMQPKELSSAVSEVNLVMGDGHVVNRKDVSLSGNVFFCWLTSEETNHGGLAKVQLIVHFGENKVASDICEFNIVGTLEGKVTAKVVIPELTAVKEGIKESELQLKDAVTASIGEVKSAELQLKDTVITTLEEIKATELQLKNSVIANNEVVDMLLRHTLTLTDDYGVDWEIAVDTDGTLRAIKKGAN